MNFIVTLGYACLITIGLMTSAQVKTGSLNLDATRNLILSTDSTQVTSQVQGGTRQSTWLGQTSSIKTGNNFIQNAGTLTVGGNLNAQIGGDWQIGAVQNTYTINAQTQGGFSNT